MHLRSSQPEHYPAAGAAPLAQLRRTEYEGTMGRQVLVALYVLAMVAIIVAVDILFLRNEFWPRLIANVGIVAVFAACYFIFFKRP
jgi:membrane associated rhomboid family serine protease